MLEYAYDEKVESLDEIQDALEYARYSSEVSYDDYATIRDILDNAVEELQEMQTLYKQLDRLKVSDADIINHKE